jgi:hypothetical protein
MLLHPVIEALPLPFLDPHISGVGILAWPGIGERARAPSEAYDIIRGLLEGSISNYRGLHPKNDRGDLGSRNHRQQSCAALLATDGKYGHTPAAPPRCPCRPSAASQACCIAIS